MKIKPIKAIVLLIWPPTSLPQRTAPTVKPRYNTDTAEGAIESVHINGVSVLSGSCY